VLRDWNGYIPDQAQHEREPDPPRRSLRIAPRLGETFVVELEWDDGNGMWINPGVSLGG
jgi:hypothetical protein